MSFHILPKNDDFSKIKNKDLAVVIICCFLYFQVLKRHSVSNFMWEVLSEDLPNELKLKVKVFYGRHGTEQNTSEFELERFPFIANFDFKEFKVCLFF